MSVLLTLKSQLSTKVTVLDKKKSVQHKKKKLFPSPPPRPPGPSILPSHLLSPYAVLLMTLKAEELRWFFSDF